MKRRSRENLEEGKLGEGKKGKLVKMTRGEIGYVRGNQGERGEGK